MTPGQKENMRWLTKETWSAWWGFDDTGINREDREGKDNDGEPRKSIPALLGDVGCGTGGHGTLPSLQSHTIQ